MSTNRVDLSQLELFDHHCHGVVARDLDRAEFEELISESSRPATAGTTRFDSQVGFGIRRHCAPLLDLEPFAEPDAYLARRRELGFDEVNRRLMRATGIGTYGIESGHAPGTITEVAETAEVAAAAVHEIVRLERLAEEVATRMHAAGEPASGFAEAIRAEIDTRLESAIGVKSIAAYRCGLDFDPTRPSPVELQDAVETWFAGFDGSWPRLANPAIIRMLLWHAIDRCAAIQLHIGYGDDDVDLHRCNPLLLTRLLRASVDSGARFMLLHCYPFHREAGYLADVFPHVYFDVGLAINYTGSRSEAVIAESLELAPFGKILFSTDAFGAAELYTLGTLLFRRGLSAALDRFIELDDWPVAEASRVADLIGHRNARRAYRLD
ncbi:amidohydrolase [Gulosibacter macacae]|uniref:Amidohydrolase n=1 Tax=Gulosibacter macacae TaxID=2488791 RepID=A0A3P3W2Y9_9MICO|nr:amidohydrolase family protein [Gulosibacter macacae]RRJ88296.1 amidohydrolase [Gulosibacter macacae]